MDIRTGGFFALVALVTGIAAPVAHAGLPLRVDEGRPRRVLEDLRRPQGFVPADVKATWGRFLDSIEKTRDSVPRPALLDPRNPKPKAPADLGDGFLDGFAQERGLHKKLKVLAGYKIGLVRAHHWLGGLNDKYQRALRGSFDSLAREAGAAESILIRQIGTDLAHGGRALEATVEHVRRAGFTEENADIAFGGVAKGLRGKLVSLANTGEIDEDTRSIQAGQLEKLERLIDG